MKRISIPMTECREQTRHYVENLLKDIEENNRRCFEDGPSIVIEFETKDGVIQSFDCENQYGSVILTDKESTFLVQEMTEQGFIKSNDCGFMEVDAENIILS